MTTTLTKPRLYLDIDGVLNASHAARLWRNEGDDPDSGYGRGFAVSREGGGGWGGNSIKYRMTWSLKLIEALNSLVDDFGLVICITSTWRNEGRDEVAKIMGLKVSEFVLHPPNGITSFPSILWKRKAVIKDQTFSPSTFVWIDDELNDLVWTDEKLDELPDDKGALLVCPDSNFGITPQHIQLIRDFLKSNIEE